MPPPPKGRPHDGSGLIVQKKCSVEIILVRKPTRGLVSDSDGATGAHRLVGARPVEHGCGPYFGSVEETTALGGSRGLPPWATSPSGGERGSPSQFLLQLKKLIKDFYIAHFFKHIL
jgi:hypothetical protein